MEASCYADPNFAIICGFFEKFGKMCGVQLPLASELLSMLECEEGVPHELASLHTQLLRKIRRTTSIEKWERTALKFCQVHLPDDFAEFEEKGYLGCTIDLKFRLLRTLLETQFDQNTRFKTAVNLLTAEELRQKPMGKDSRGRIYWCHLDVGANFKVYREDPAAEDGGWMLVASDRASMVDLIQTLTGDATMDLSPIVEPPAPVMDTGQESSDDADGEEGNASDGSDEENAENILSEGATEVDDSDDKETTETGVEEDTTLEDDSKKRKIDTDDESNLSEAKKPKVADEESVSEAIEEPTLLVEGEGNGADCKTGVPFECSEAIEEDVFYVQGEGTGVECDAGNDEREDVVNSSEQPSEPVSSIFDTTSSDHPVGEPSTSTADLPDSSADGLFPVVSSSSPKSVGTSNADEAACAPSSSDNVQQKVDSSDSEKPKLWSIDDICSSSEQGVQPDNSEERLSTVAVENVLDNVADSNAPSVAEITDNKLSQSSVSSVPDSVGDEEQPTKSIPDLDQQTVEESPSSSKIEDRTCPNLSVPEIIITPNTPEAVFRIKNDSPLPCASPEPEVALPVPGDAPVPKSPGITSDDTQEPQPNPSEVSSSAESKQVSPTIQVQEVDLPVPTLCHDSDALRSDKQTEDCAVEAKDTFLSANIDRGPITPSNSAAECPAIKSENTAGCETEPIAESCVKDLEDISSSNSLAKKTEETTSNNTSCESTSPEVKKEKDVEETISQPTVDVNVQESADKPAIACDKSSSEEETAASLKNDTEVSNSSPIVPQQEILPESKGEDSSSLDAEKSMLNNAETIAKISQKMGLNCSESESTNDKPLDSSALGSIGKLENMVDDFKRGNPVDVTAYRVTVDMNHRKDTEGSSCNNVNLDNELNCPRDEDKLPPEVASTVINEKETVGQKPELHSKNGEPDEAIEAVGGEGASTPPITEETNQLVASEIDKQVKQKICDSLLQASEKQPDEKEKVSDAEKADEPTSDTAVQSSTDSKTEIDEEAKKVAPSAVPEAQDPAVKNTPDESNDEVTEKDSPAINASEDENEKSKSGSESDDDRDGDTAFPESEEKDSSEDNQKENSEASEKNDTSADIPAPSAPVDEKSDKEADVRGDDRENGSDKEEKSSNLGGKRKPGRKKKMAAKEDDDAEDAKNEGAGKEDPLGGNEDPLATPPKDADPLALGEETGKRKKKKKSEVSKKADASGDETEKDKKSKPGSYYIPAREIQSLGANDENSGSPSGVRQSRRIAVIKLKEAEERRRQEEIELEAFKSKTKKKKVKAKYDEDYQEDESDADDEVKEKKAKKEKKYKFDPKKAWMTSSDDSEADEEAEPEEDEIEEEHEEPVYKSDHEFSPESDVEDPDYQPVRVARTAQARKVTPADKYEDVACSVCEKSDQPEWILLCDECDKGAHTSCLTPPLHMVPDGEWFCPACSLAKLVVNLKKTLRDYDRCEKQRENEELRKKRLAFVGISLNNVLPPAKKPKKSERSGSESESGSESGSARSGSAHSSDESAPVYQLRERRTNTSSYRFNEYDELIRSAIREEMDEGAGGEACEAAGPEAEAQPSAQDQDEVASKDVTAASDAEDDEEGEKAGERKKEGDYSAETDADSDGDEPPPVVPRKRKTKKKRKKLLSLDFSSDDEDDQNSDSDFKGSSLDEEDDDFEEEGSDSDFSGGRRKRKGQRGGAATRRSARAHQRRLDKDFIDDETSEDEGSGSNREFDTTESSDSDRSWGRKKKNKSRKRRPPTPPSRKKKKVVTKKKNRKKVKTADSDDDSDREYKNKRSKKKAKSGLDSDPETKITNRRTRGKQINFVWDNDGTDSEQERLKRKRRTGRVGRFASEESDEEFKVQEDEKMEDDEDDVDEFNSDDASSGDAPATKKAKVEKPVAKANSAKKGKPATKTHPAKKVKKVSSESDEDELDDLDEEAEEELMEMLDKRDMPVDELKDAVKKTKERKKEPETPVKKKGCKVKITPTRAEIAEKAAAAKAKKAENTSLLKKSLETEESSKVDETATGPLMPIGQEGGMMDQGVTSTMPPGVAGLPQAPPMLPNMPMGAQQNVLGPHGGPPPMMGPGPQGGLPLMGPMGQQLPRPPMHPHPGMAMPPGGYPPNTPRMPMGPMQGSPQHMQMMGGMQRGPPPGMPVHGMLPQPAGPHPMTPMGGQLGMPLPQPGVRMPMGGQFPPPPGAFPVQGQFGSPGSSPNFSPSPEAKQRRKPGPKPGSKNKKKNDGEESPAKGKPRNRKGDDVTIATVQAPTQFPEAANVEEGSVITRMLNSAEGGVPEGSPGHHMLGTPRPPLYHPPRPMDPSPSGGGAVAIAKPPFPPGQFPTQFQNFHQPPFPGYPDGAFPSEQVPQGPQGPTPVQVPPKNFDEEEVSEFGGLASYFASQAEEDMDT